ncbi:MAG: right-handed parallel beta-helix repeat-containing protein [Bacteroidales bacterium]|nr:right-handed parallel beta-helix repeat-containing protein [Bacteroidales bacterium]MBN2819594.1 right-handed parallel beta-helix repeat-containing protein [Bacteroidales bacterium]
MKLNQLSVYFIFLSLTLIFSCSKEDTKIYGGKYYESYTFEKPVINGQTFYIDPVNGSPNGDGSIKHPWRTLQEVIDSHLVQCYKPSESYNAESDPELINQSAPIEGGDRIILLSGYHGFLNLNYFMFTDWLTIEGAEGADPVFSQIKFTGAFKNIYLKNLTIDKSSYERSKNFWEAEDINQNSKACLYLGSSDFWGNCSNIKVDNLKLRTTTEVSGWTTADWVEKASDGIALRSAKNIEVVNCKVENVRHGITVDYNSEHSKVVNNSVIDFCGDGSRVNSNHVLFAYNTIIGCLKVDDNHDDGIQSFSRGDDGTAGTGVVSGVTIRGNIIIGVKDFNNPMYGSLQGIGCFDGMFDNWIVENNLIVSNTYHGISFYGMLNSKILNNTVIDQVTGDDVSPWILIHEHKNGTESNNCTIANNIVSSSVSYSGENVEAGNNFVFGKSNYDSVLFMFVDPQNNDFHLLDNAYTRNNIIDKGMVFKSLVSSQADLEQELRADSPDLGAYEYVE